MQEIDDEIRKLSDSFRIGENKFWVIFFLYYLTMNDDLQKRLQEERQEMYMELRKAVIREFVEYAKETDVDVADLLSNVLLGIHKTQKYGEIN